ncbi:hypothetical protein Dxin01_03350 [Deinococcus xinjiangensis]|uniref:Uncharacterized protein n=2 Tax=Deinococcus xinjiangensis TaxID=457454 RepID=A0ABP9VFQ9_9DEIO
MTFPEQILPWELWRTVQCWADTLVWEGGLCWPLGWITEPEDLVYSRVRIQDLGDWPLFRPLAANQQKMTTNQLSRWVGEAYYLAPKELKVAEKFYAVPVHLLLQRLVDLAMQFRQVRPEVPFDEYLRTPWRRRGDWTGGDAHIPLNAVLNGNLRHIEEVLLNYVQPGQLLTYGSSRGNRANPWSVSPEVTASRTGLKNDFRSGK